MRSSSLVAFTLLGAAFAAVAVSAVACGGGSPPAPQAPASTVWPTSSAYPAATVSAAPSTTERATPATPAGCIDLSKPVPWSGEGTMLRDTGVPALKPVKALCWVGDGDANHLAKDADRFGLELGNGMSDTEAAKMEAHVRALAGRKVRLSGTLHASTGRPRTDPPYPYALDLTVTTIEADGKTIWPMNAAPPTH